MNNMNERMDLVIETGAPSNLILAYPYPALEVVCFPVLQKDLYIPGMFIQID